MGDEKGGALTADEIAHTAEFFSFGTNDLTQTALGISRDDMGSFLMPYVENEIFKKNPFATLDQVGVGQLMKIGVIPKSVCEECNDISRRLVRPNV